MTDRRDDQDPFDERAVLAELEQFQSEIDRYRRQRASVQQDFEQFVGSFPSPESVFPSEASEPVRLPPLPRQAAAPRQTPSAPSRAADATTRRREVVSIPRPATVRAADPARAAVPPAIEALDARISADGIDRTPPAQTSEPRRRSRAPLLGVVVAALAAAGVWLWNAGRPQPAEQPEAPPAAQASPSTPAPTTAAPPAASAPAAATESVLTTVRPAWVRVIADGERVVERELPADSRVAFDAQKTIVIRTGDAGAVRLSIRGQDHGALGRDGQVVTRSFDVPPAPRR